MLTTEQRAVTAARCYQFSAPSRPQVRRLVRPTNCASAAGRRRAGDAEPWGTVAQTSRSDQASPSRAAACAGWAARAISPGESRFGEKPRFAWSGGPNLARPSFCRDRALAREDRHRKCNAHTCDLPDRTSGSEVAQVDHGSTREHAIGICGPSRRRRSGAPRSKDRRDRPEAEGEPREYVPASCTSHTRLSCAEPPSNGSCGPVSYVTRLARRRNRACRSTISFYPAGPERKKPPVTGKEPAG